MVAMLVGQEQDIDAVRLDAHHLQTLMHLTQTESVVHEDAASPGFDQRGIATTAAAE
jgi:hypothetical protein